MRFLTPLCGLFLLVCLMQTGCASSSQITTQPPGAQITVDGMRLGKSPVVYTDPQVWLWTNHMVFVQKRGYQSMSAPLNGQAKVVNVVCGILLCPFGLILAAAGELPPQKNFSLIRTGVDGVPVQEMSQDGEARIDFAQ